MKGDPDRVREALRDALGKRTSREVVVLFCRETADFHPLDLSWRLLPAVGPLLEENDALFGDLAAMLASESLKAEFRIHLLDALDRVVRRRRKVSLSTHRFWDRLLQVAEYPSEPEALRARALRTLSRDRRKETVADVLPILKGAHGKLLDGGARLAAAWRRDGVKLPRAFETVLLGKASALIKEGSFPGPGLLKALKAFGSPASRSLLGRLPAAAKTPDQRHALFAVLGDRLDTAALGKVIRMVGSEPAPEDAWALRALNAVRPKAVDELFRKRLHRESLLLERFRMGASDPKASHRVLTLKSHRDSALRRLAIDTASLLREDKVLADYFKTLNFHESVKVDRAKLMKSGVSALPLEPALPAKILTRDQVLAAARDLLKDILSPTGKRPKPPRETSGESSPPPAPPVQVTAPFRSEMHLADALYRNLIWKLTGVEHWHAAVYLGVTPSADGRTMESRLAQLVGPPTAIAPTTATVTVGPSDDVAARMKELKDRLLLAFNEGDAAFPFHGAKHPPGLTHHQRTAIASLVTAMTAMDVSYTAGDMLDYDGWDWDGTLDDIDQLRCDGVVEYAYEKNGIRVCRGEKETRWNISRARAEFAENHNDLHNHDYNRGELCPRVQANGEDRDRHRRLTDSSMKPTKGTHPHVSSFHATRRYWPDVPELSFRIESSTYDNAYVRIVVRKGDSGPFRFVVTDDPYASNALTGTWGMRLAACNTRSSHLLYWRGKTHDGTDFAGQDGEYEFRIVAVDHGGSVSACLSRKLTVTWKK